MGSGSSKVNNNRTPPSPNTSNFPVQSNPKFQSHSNQYPNEWPNQKDQQFGNNNKMNKSHFPANFQDRNSPFVPNNATRLNKINNRSPNAIQLSPMEIDEYRRQGLHFPPHSLSRNSCDGYRVPCDMVNEENEEHTITVEEVNLVRNIYDQNCGPDGRMDFQQFQNMYQHDFETSRRAFAIMDRDMDGLLTFDDFLLGYCRTRPQSEQIEYEEREYQRPEPRQIKRIDEHLPFGPLDEYDPYTTPIENIAASLKPLNYFY